MLKLSFANNKSNERKIRKAATRRKHEIKSTVKLRNKRKMTVKIRRNNEHKRESVGGDWASYL